MTTDIKQGDCLELMKEIKDKSIDMILCDLPYGITANNKDIKLNLNKLWEQYNRIIKTNGAIVLTAAQPFTSELVLSNLKLFKYDLIWEKNDATGHLNSKKMPMRAHESILLFYKKLPIYNPIKTFGHKRKTTKRVERFRLQSENYGIQKGITQYDSTERYPRSVLKFATDKQKSKLHPTQKPVALFEYLIKTYSKEGDTILDNCMGSGTTGIACINTNRNFIGIELNYDYYSIAKLRIEFKLTEK